MDATTVSCVSFRVGRPPPAAAAPWLVGSAVPPIGVTRSSATPSGGNRCLDLSRAETTLRRVCPEVLDPVAAGAGRQPERRRGGRDQLRRGPGRLLGVEQPDDRVTARLALGEDLRVSPVGRSATRRSRPGRPRSRHGSRASARPSGVSPWLVPNALVTLLVRLTPRINGAEPSAQRLSWLCSAAGRHAAGRGAVADLDRVVVVEPAGTAVWLPLRRRRRSGRTTSCSW